MMPALPGKPVEQGDDECANLWSDEYATISVFPKGNHIINH